MKIRITGISFLTLAFAATSALGQEQQSPFQTPAATTVVGQSATVGSPMLLKITGVTVTDQSGQPLGPVQHIVLNPTGCADLALLSLGGTRLVPIPWQLVSGTGAVRGETEVTGQATLVSKVDRTILERAPAFNITQISQVTQPQMVQQVHAYFTQHQQQSAVGGTGSQTNINVGVSDGVTNRAGAGTSAGVGATNQASLTNKVGVTNQAGVTNRGNIPSATGPTSAIPGRPSFETNRPGQPSITPPTNRPPTTRPPTNRPPTTTPGQPAPRP